MTDFERAGPGETGRHRLVRALVHTVAQDREQGIDPIAICANAGASSTGAIDSLEAMAGFREKEGIWPHVNAGLPPLSHLTRARAMMSASHGLAEIPCTELPRDCWALDANRSRSAPVGAGT